MGIMDNNAPRIRNLNGVSIKKTVGAVFKFVKMKAVLPMDAALATIFDSGIGDFRDTRHGVDSMKSDSTYGAIARTTTALMFGSQGGIARNVL
jgi:hypothetical protein